MCRKNFYNVHFRQHCRIYFPKAGIYTIFLYASLGYYGSSVERRNLAKTYSNINVLK